MTVDIQVLKPSRTIVLNALDLEFTRATLLGQPETALKPVLDPRKQTLELKLPRQLAPGQYRLALEFTGRLTEQAQGLFYARYRAASGQKIMLCTQMEATDARRMFPCWDEPVFRATFDLTAVVPEAHVAVSNMPIEKETKLPGGLKEVTFARTPPMASYLVALISGELESLSGESEGVQIHVYTTAGRKEQGRYALEAARKLLVYYDQYFGIKYPLPKLDLIAVPGGFSGAMENWGAITFEEGELLFDPASSSQNTRQDIFVTVAHEMAHQWFGNLVTMAWWDDLWLNEGFASWMENKATDHFNPDWQMWLAAGSEKSSVMSRDARGATHPIQQPVRNESGANDAFDSITYVKGQSLLRMLETYLGEETFRQGIHEYLSGHLYSNTTTADLWAALGKASGKPIERLCAGWTEQPGLPVVKVDVGGTNQGRIYRLEQERFTVDDAGARRLVWVIPVAYRNAGAATDTTSFSLLEAKPALVALPDQAAAILVNAGDAGYYRVWYEPGLFRELLQIYQRLPDADRFGLLDDAWAMVEGNRASSATYLDLVRSIHAEKTCAIWQQIISTIDFIDELQQYQPGRDGFAKFARAELRLPWRRLGFEPTAGEPATDSLLRGSLFASLGEFGDADILAEARAKYKEFLAAPDALAADARPAVLKIVGRYADKTTYEQIHNLAREASGTEERQLYYRALAGALDIDLARATLELSLTNELPPQEAAALVSQAAHLGEHPELAWAFFLQHGKALLAKVDAYERNGYAPSIADAFCDASRADELEAYVRKNLPADALAKAREAEAEIRFKASLKRRELPIIDKWVETNAARSGL